MIWPLQLLVSAAVAALLAVSAHAGTGVSGLAVATLAVGLGLGWPGLLRLPHPRGSSLVVVASGVAGAAVAALGPLRDNPLGALASLAALSVLAAFVHELLRRDGRERLVESVTGTYAGQAVALLACGWALLPGSSAGPGAAIVGAGAMVAARLAAVVPARALAPWVGVGAAVVAGAALAPYADGLGRGAGAIVGVTVGALVAAADRMLAVEAEQQPRRGGGLGALAASLAPIAAAGTGVYAVVRIVVGA